MSARIDAMIAEITHHHEIDQKSGRKAVDLTDIPISYEAITPAWLTAVLCRGTPGARVESYSLDAPDNGSSNRRRIFIEYNVEGKRASLPATVFCKASIDLLNRIMLGVSGCARTEINFYNNVRPMLDIEAPVSMFAEYDPTSYASIVVLKDLGGAAQFCNHLTEMTWERAVSQVKLLANFHSRFHEDPALKSGKLGLVSWPEMWGNQVENSMEQYCNKGFLAAEEVMPARLFRRHDEIWPATARSVELHKGRPQTLTHGDVHLKNWYVRDGNRMGLGDWQVASVGHWSRDIAYAISTAHTVENRRKWEKDLFRIYLDAMAQGRAEVPSFDQAWTYYRQQLFSALAFWTITLRPAPSQPEMQPLDITLEFLRRLTHAIDDLDAFDSFK